MRQAVRFVKSSFAIGRAQGDQTRESPNRSMILASIGERGNSPIRSPRIMVPIMRSRFSINC